MHWNKDLAFLSVFYMVAFVCVGLRIVDALGMHQTTDAHWHMAMPTLIQDWCRMVFKRELAAPKINQIAGWSSALHCAGSCAPCTCGFSVTNSACSWTYILPAWFDPGLLNGLAYFTLLCMTLAYPPHHALSQRPHLLPNLGFEQTTLLASSLLVTCLLPHHVPPVTAPILLHLLQCLGWLPGCLIQQCSSRDILASSSSRRAMLLLGLAPPILTLRGAWSLAAREALSPFGLHPGMWYLACSRTVLGKVVHRSPTLPGMNGPLEELWESVDLAYSHFPFLWMIFIDEFYKPVTTLITFEFYFLQYHPFHPSNCVTVICSSQIISLNILLG